MGSDENPSRFLSNILNISKNGPELIEYYDLDELTTVPEIIYPDPDAMFNSKNKENLKTTSNELETKMTDAETETAWHEHEHDQHTEFESEQHEIFNSDGGGSNNYQNMFTLDDIKNDDLREHDIIDNIMYIYYGSSVALRKSLGGSIIIFGTVFALAAQILSVIFTLLRNR